MLTSLIKKIDESNRTKVCIVQHEIGSACLNQLLHHASKSNYCWLAVGRLSVTCRSTDGRQLTDSWPTGFLGSSSSQLPIWEGLLERDIKSISQKLHGANIQSSFKIYLDRPKTVYDEFNFTNEITKISWCKAINTFKSQK